LLVSASAAASINRKLPLEELAAAADVIVLGRVDAVVPGVDSSVDGVYTYITIEPLEVFKGLAPGSGPIVVKQLGGAVATRGIYVPGQATFDIGEEVLLFLGARPRDGSLFTLGLWQGKWIIHRDPASGERRALQQEPRTRLSTNQRSLTDVRQVIVGIAGRTPAAASHVSPRPVDAPLGRQSSPFVLYDPPVRWMQPVVPIHVETGSHPGLPGGGAAEVGAAAAQWNAVGSSMALSVGGRLPPRCQAAFGDSIILVTFNDPCGEISADPAVLAIAAFGYIPDAGQLVNGQLFLPITGAVITTSSNPEAQDFLTSSPCFQTTMAHEIGHAIGLAHTPDESAIMFFSQSPACFQAAATLAPDDIAALLALYPMGGGQGGTPGQPTVTAATATGGVLTVTWTSGSGATPTAHRLEFFAGGALAAAVNVGAATTASIPIPPGTQGSFSVRVTALSGTTPGPASALFPFTIGGPPGGGTGGCTGPPAAPVVGGSIVAGAATVSWPAIPGATYIVSAGSTPGASDLYAAANVGALTSVSASGLPAGFFAWVRVVAVNACGQSAPADFFLAPGSQGTSVADTFLVFEGRPEACACWSSSITVEIDGAVVGSMSCSSNAGPFPISGGAHSYRLCNAQSCVSNSTTVPSFFLRQIRLVCQ
jgi:hypothetical protein